MIPSNVGPVPAELLRKRNIIDCGAPGPMPQQAAGDSHGREMYPQKFVRLVGYHDPDAGKREDAYRLN
jgi:hypothetical protein